MQFVELTRMIYIEIHIIAQLPESREPRPSTKKAKKVPLRPNFVMKVFCFPENKTQKVSTAG